MSEYGHDGEDKFSDQERVVMSYPRAEEVVVVGRKVGCSEEVVERERQDYGPNGEGEANDTEPSIELPAVVQKHVPLLCGVFLLQKFHVLARERRYETWQKYMSTCEVFFGAWVG